MRAESPELNATQYSTAKFNVLGEVWRTWFPARRTRTRTQLPALPHREDAHRITVDRGTCHVRHIFRNSRRKVGVERLFTLLSEDAGLLINLSYH